MKKQFLKNVVLTESRQRHITDRTFYSPKAMIRQYTPLLDLFLTVVEVRIYLFIPPGSEKPPNSISNFLRI